MLLALQQNLLLQTGASMAFIGPDIDDLIFPEDILITPVDLTDRFIGVTTYTLIGTLPNGMSFTNGVLSGTPTTPGSYGPFVIKGY